MTWWWSSGAPSCSPIQRCAAGSRTFAGTPRVDAVLVSHLHRDHLDLPSLGLVDPAARVVAPRGGARALRRSGREVVAVAAGELLALAGVRVRVVPALHDGRRRR
jgi:L-ascorbate metabolism protein UlaG (beta-lactamase superfamily)